MAKDPATTEAQEAAENELEKIAVAISTAILAVFAYRLGQLKDANLIDVYASMGKDMAQIEAITQKGREALEYEVRRTFESMAKGNDKWAKPYYNAAGVKQTVADESLVSILNVGIDEAMEDVDSLVRTSALGVENKKGNLVSIRSAYVNIVGSAANDMISGAATYDDAIGGAVKLLSNGVKVRYPQRSVELYAAVRMNVMDAYRRTMVAQRLEHGDRFGADGVEVSAHMPCAIDHMPYQGNQYSKIAFEGIQAELGRQLVTGANCRHTVWPIILGVDIPAYSKSQIAEMSRKSNEVVTVTGLSGDPLTMTRYDASQYQRRVEQSLRQMNVDRFLLDVGTQAEAAAKMEAAIKKRTAQYRVISKQAGLPVHMARTAAYVL